MPPVGVALPGGAGHKPSSVRGGMRVVDPPPSGWSGGGRVSIGVRDGAALGRAEPAVVSLPVGRRRVNAMPTRPSIGQQSGTSAGELGDVG
jgi:hypothetical protein